MMVPSAPSDDIHDFLTFLDAIGASEVLRGRAGSPRQDIERFEKLARLPLPALYRGYLREFGGNDGGLRMASDAKPRLADLIEFYEGQSQENFRQVPKNGIVIAAQGFSGARALVYEDEPPAEPRVVDSWWGKVGKARAASFRNFLYQAAFVWAHFIAKDNYPTLYRNDILALKEVVAAASEIGLQPYWFSDDFQSCLESSTVALCVYRDDKHTVVHLDGPNPDAMEDVKTKLIRKLNMVDASRK